MSSEEILELYITIAIATMLAAFAMPFVFIYGDEHPDNPIIHFINEVAK